MLPHEFGEGGQPSGRVPRSEAAKTAGINTIQMLNSATHSQIASMWHAMLAGQPSSERSRSIRSSGIIAGDATTDAAANVGAMVAMPRSIPPAGRSIESAWLQAEWKEGTKRRRQR